MKPGNDPGGAQAIDAGEVPMPSRTDDVQSTHEAGAFPNAVDRALSIRKVGNTVSVTLGDYTPDSLAFLFAWDPVANKEIYVRAGRRSELEEQARTQNAEGREYFVLPRNESEKKTLFARVDDSASAAPSSAFGSRSEGHVPQAQAPQAAGATEHAESVFVVVPRNRQPRQPFRVEKNLDGRHWTSKAEAEGALAAFEHEHADIAGAMSVRAASLRFSL